MRGRCTSAAIGASCPEALKKTLKALERLCGQSAALTATRGIGTLNPPKLQSMTTGALVDSFSAVSSVTSHCSVHSKLDKKHILGGKGVDGIRDFQKSRATLLGIFRTMYMGNHVWKDPYLKEPSFSM